MQVELYPEEEYLRVVATGPFTLESAKRTFGEVMDGVAAHGVRKVLFDGRALTGEPELLERYEYGEFLAKTVAAYASGVETSGMKLAYILLPPVRHERGFGQTVAQNRGANVQTFDDAESALAWLGVEV